MGKWAMEPVPMANAAASLAGVGLAPSIVVAHLEVAHLTGECLPLVGLAGVEMLAMGSVPTKGSAAANGAGAEPTQSTVVAHPEVAHPPEVALVPLVGLAGVEM